MRYGRYFEAAIGQLRNERRYRVFANLERDVSDVPRAVWRGDDGAQRDVTIWCSNDYLGMGRHPDVVEAMRSTAAKLGAGAGGTRNISGTNAPLVALEAELADLLFEKVGLNKREAKDMVEAFFDELRLALENGDSVKLSGFGNFQLREKPQRPGRNPKTGEEIPITARRVVTFHASQKLKAAVEAFPRGDGKQ